MAQTQQEKKKEQEIAKMKADVLEQELSARSWKAYYDKMYYTIECSKIESEYQEVAAANVAKFKAQQEKMQELLANMGQETPGLNVTAEA